MIYGKFYLESLLIKEKWDAETEKSKKHYEELTAIRNGTFFKKGVGKYD